MQPDGSGNGQSAAGQSSDGQSSDGQSSDGQQATDAQDPPVTVGRLAALDGTVNEEPAGINQWSTAADKERGMFQARLRSLDFRGFQSSAFAICFLLMSLAATASAQAGQPTPWAAHPEMHAEWKAWRETMKKHPLPKKKGCFHATYPATEWTETTCTVAPNRPYPPVHARGSQPMPNTVGGGGSDYTAKAVSGLLSSADGSFLSIAGLTSATIYSLQLNSNTFTTSACSGAAYPSACLGWQQFVFSYSSSQVFMQYWLLNWNTTCPGGWTGWPNGTNDDCYFNSTATNVPVQPFANIPQLELTGEAASGTDTIVLSTPDGNLSAVGQDSVLNLDQGWDAAEFNIFGDCCGNQVNFNSGSTFVVQTSVNNGSTDAPYCPNESFTGETNNLNLIGSCCSYGGPSPNIQFMESSDSSATASCGASGLQGNPLGPTPTPYNSTSVTIYGSEYPTLTFTETLYDSAPGAVIYWQVSGCSGSTSGSSAVSSGGSFMLTYQSQFNCNPSGTMYAQAPGGYLPSPTVPISF